MALIVEFTCELPNGVHARPASLVETLCNTFHSHMEWHNLRTDRKGNAKSALALIGTDTLRGDSCRLSISGADEQAAHQRLSQWLRDEFPRCDAPLAEVKNSELAPLPVSLTNLNPQFFRACSVCSGSASGVLTRLAALDLNALGPLPTAKDVDSEQSALDNGLTLLMKNIEFRLLDSDGSARTILEAHRSLVGDTSLRQHLMAGVSRGLSCAQAIVESARHFGDTFARSLASIYRSARWTSVISLASSYNKFMAHSVSRPRVNSRNPRSVWRMNSRPASSLSSTKPSSRACC